MIQTTRGEQSAGRILFVITSLTFGGAETQVARLAIELKARGWQVAVASLVEPRTHSARLEGHGIEVRTLGMRRGIPDPRALLRLRSIVRSFQPDIVHSHMVHANLLARATRLICPFPVLICTAHNLRESSEKGGRTWHKELLYRATDFLADQTTIICHAAYDRYLRVGAVPAAKLQVIPNGVDTNAFSPVAQACRATTAPLEQQHPFVWLTVGRLVKQKDFPSLLRAFELVPGNSLLIVAGSGPLEAELRRECCRLGLTARVRFQPATENILPLYQSVDGFVLSSKFEGLSAALLEAASVGLPAVVTNVGGNAEVVMDEISGILVPPSSPARLAEAMRRLEALPLIERRLWGAAARRHACSHYGIEAITQQWVDLYTDLLGRSGHQPARLAHEVSAARLTA